MNHRQQQTETNAHLLDSRWGFAAIGFMLLGVAIASFKLTTPYSLWLDELYSATISSESWQILYQLLLDDVHPPLYQVLLKAWILTFGSSEVATRTLSWLFTIAAICPLWQFAKRYGHVFLVCCLIFFCTNTLFTQYANETRAYAMALFFATWAVTAYLSDHARRVPNALLALCLILSLTHYFGLILAGLILAFCFFENLRRPMTTARVVVTGLLMLLWPIHHALHGSLLHKTGGHFWIKVDGPLDSYGVAASIIITRLGQVGGCVFLLALATIAATSVYARRRSQGPSDELHSITLKAALLAFTFASVVAVIDVFSPMSTKRNYIVLLPLMVILMASFFNALCTMLPRGRHAVMACACLFAVGASALAFKHMQEKSAAHQDWKTASRYMSEHADGRQLYFASDKTNNPLLLQKVYNFYLNKASGGRLVAQPYFVGETRPRTPALVFFAHFKLDELKADMAKAGATQVQPEPGASPKDTGVYLIER